MNPIYPIYIPSKMRFDKNLTARRLEAMGVPHFVVVEECEEKQYANALGRDRLLVLPFSNLGQGSIPARNWIFEHSLQRGDKRHWIIDDNVRRFFRLHMNRRTPVTHGSILRAAEVFTDRYENIAFSGLNNIAFAPDRSPNVPAFTWNTRIYSITLLNNAIPYRWRGKYNEDTDICLRALKDGWVTVQFNAFLADKLSTLTCKGGNTDTIYNTGDSRLAFAKSLEEQHPDVVKVTWKFDRWHHQVDYSPFKKNRPILRADVTPVASVNEFGMELCRRPKYAHKDAELDAIEGESVANEETQTITLSGSNGEDVIVENVPATSAVGNDSEGDVSQQDVETIDEDTPVFDETPAKPEDKPESPGNFFGGLFGTSFGMGK